MQYETKRAWNFLQSWLVGNKGILKGGGGVQLLLPAPLNFFFGKVKKRYNEDEKWMGKEVVVPVNIISRGDTFSGGFEIFSGGGGWLRNFQGGQMLEPPPPPGNLLLFFENRRGTKKGWGMISANIF